MTVQLSIQPYRWTVRLNRPIGTTSILHYHTRDTYQYTTYWNLFWLLTLNLVMLSLRTWKYIWFCFLTHVSGCKLDLVLFYSCCFLQNSVSPFLYWLLAESLNPQSPVLAMSGWTTYAVVVHVYSHRNYSGWLCYLFCEGQWMTFYRGNSVW